MMQVGFTYKFSIVKKVMNFIYFNNLKPYVMQSEKTCHMEKIQHFES